MHNENEINEEFSKMGIEPVAKQEEKVVEVEVQQTNDDKQYSDFEQECIDLGWKPDGEYGAAEWKRNFSLTKTIKRLGEDNKDLKRTLKEVKDFMSRQTQKEIDHDDREFKRIRSEAIKMGDVDLVEKIDKEHTNFKQQQHVPQSIPEFDEFNEKYKEVVFAVDGDEFDMRVYLHQVEQALIGVQLTPKEYTDKLENALKRKFPSYFNKESEEEPLTQAVESGIQSNVKKPLRRKVTMNDLSREQRDMFDSFKKHGFPITEEQYIKDLVDQGVLK